MSFLSRLRALPPAASRAMIRVEFKPWGKKVNRNQRRASDKNGKRMQALPWSDFKDVTEESKSLPTIQQLLKTGKKPPDQVWLNTKFSVQCYHHERMLGHSVTRAMIRRNDSQPIYSWYDLQRLKNEIFGEDAEAFQMFPKDSKLVDQANIYWMFVIVKRGDEAKDALDIET